MQAEALYGQLMLHLGPVNLRPHPRSCLWNNQWQLGWIYTARCNLRGFVIFFFFPLKWHERVSWKKKLACSEIVRPPSYVGKKIRYEPGICKYAWCRLCRQSGYLSTLWVIENADRRCRRQAFNKVTLLSPSSAPLKPYRMYREHLCCFTRSDFI